MLHGSISIKCFYYIKNTGVCKGISGSNLILLFPERSEIASKQRVILQFLFDVFQVLPRLRLGLSDKQDEFLLRLSEDRPENEGHVHDRRFGRAAKRGDDNRLQVFILGHPEHLFLERSRPVLHVMMEVAVKE